MNRMVVAFVDGSPLSEHTVPWAAELAARSAAELYLVQAYLPAVSLAPDAIGFSHSVVTDAGWRDEDEHHLADLAGRVRDTWPGLVVSAHSLDGNGPTDLAGTLARYADEAGAEFAVLATHGRGGLARLLVGSVAAEFARRTTVPTLLIRPPADAPPDPADRPAVRHVLVPLDGSPLAEQAVAPACRLARLFRADITLLRVLDPAAAAAPLPGLGTAGLPADWQPPPAAEHARQYLAHVARRVRDQDICCHTEVADGRSAADATLAHHHARHGSVVALATHGRGGLTRLLLGSVADKVIRGAAGPVLVVRPG